MGTSILQSAGCSAYHTLLPSTCKIGFNVSVTTCHLVLGLSGCTWPAIGFFFGVFTPKTI